MKRFLGRFKYNLIMGGLFAILAVLPDYIFQLIVPNVHYVTDILFIAVISVFGFFLSMSGIFVYVICCTAFMIMQLIQLGHIAYFARPINPLDIGKVFSEFNDIYSASVTDMDDFWFVPTLAIIPFLLLIFCEFKWRKKLYFSFLGIVAVIIFLGVKPERATRRGLHHFLPPETRYSIHNSINSFSFYFVRGFDKESISDIVPKDFYKPYGVHKKSSSADLVVLVMGESTSADKMHLYNSTTYPNTPQLEKIADNNPLFFKAKAISGGVSTHASLPIFFNMMKEPGNIRQLTSYSTNLFKMAKENGYNTYFYSAYDMKQTNLIGVPYIDHIITIEKNRHRFKMEKEDYLLELFKEINLQEKSFVVLNFRSTHSPYEKCYEHHKEFKKFEAKDDSRMEEENTAYANAVLYIDSILGKMIKHIEKHKNLKVHFLFTADHGEMLGYPDGQYGHNRLEKEVYTVPFIWIGQKDNPISLHSTVSHYEIAEIIADLLGYEVQNPNFDNQTFFVHGNNLFEDYEFIKIKRDQENEIEIEPIQTVSRYIAKAREQSE
ncbi:MAG: sulfatase-like hydrolase/transferase [Alphaproteobacteria bacterium]|nr:sulfatase-like hydrolase/transferase [Alphaproteobacteria bacterium]